MLLNMFAITQKLLDQKNKARQGYKKVMDTLYSCTTQEQYEVWLDLAQIYMDTVCFHLDKYDHHTRWAIWERKQYRQWYEEVDWMGQEIINQGQEYYKSTFGDEEPKKDTASIVVRGFGC